MREDKLPDRAFFYKIVGALYPVYLSDLIKRVEETRETKTVMAANECFGL